MLSNKQVKTPEEVMIIWENFAKNFTNALQPSINAIVDAFSTPELQSINKLILNSNLELADLQLNNKFEKGRFNLNENQVGTSNL